MSAPAKKKTLKKSNTKAAKGPADLPPPASVKIIDPNVSNAKLYDDLEDIQDITPTKDNSIINLKPTGKPTMPPKTVTVNSPSGKKEVKEYVPSESSEEESSEEDDYDDESDNETSATPVKCNTILIES